MGRLRYGTSSWSEKSWAGVFYPRGMRPGDYLRSYAERFDTVEADVTYYRVPDPVMVRGWRAKTPAGFTLSAKFPRSVVHGGEGPRPDPDVILVPERVRGDVDDFLRSMALLGERCGPLVLQFPYLARDVFPEARVFLDRLERFLGSLPKDFRYAVEVRNRGFLRQDLADLLSAKGVALVWADMARMPHPAELQGRLELLTTDFAYVRLIGDRRAVEARTKTFDQVVLDKSAELQRWADFLTPYLERVPEVYAYANNHYAGHGPATIRELARRMGIDAPEPDASRPPSEEGGLPFEA